MLTLTVLGPSALVSALAICQSPKLLVERYKGDMYAARASICVRCLSSFGCYVRSAPASETMSG